MAKAKYTLHVPSFMEAYATVELEELDPDGNPRTMEAMVGEATENADMPSLCHQCAGWRRPEGFEDSGEFDWDKAYLIKKEDGEHDY